VLAPDSETENDLHHGTRQYVSHCLAKRSESSQAS